jgi:DNA-directed RNA polymerase subunit K/omega
MSEKKKPDIFKSRYLFVTLVYERLKQLEIGKKPKIEIDKKKLASIAQEEIARGLVSYTVQPKEEKKEEE